MGEAAAGGLPLSLPDNIVPLHKMNSHYSLKLRLRDQQPLRDQVAALSRWTHAPVQLDRNGGQLSGLYFYIYVYMQVQALSHTRADFVMCAAERTWNNLLSNIYLFLGFLNMFMGR